MKAKHNQNKQDLNTAAVKAWQNIARNETQYDYISLSKYFSKYLKLKVGSLHL